MARIKQVETQRLQAKKASQSAKKTAGQTKKSDSPTLAGEKKTRKKRRNRRKWLQEVRRQQGVASTKFAVPVAPTQRLIREIAGGLEKGDLRFSKDALRALQTATEEFTIDLNRRANKYVVHAGRQTMKVTDIRQAAQDMKEEDSRITSFSC